MLSDQSCSCNPKTDACGGKLSRAELKMHEMRPELSAQEYHEILNLFDAAFDAIADEIYGVREANG